MDTPAVRKGVFMFAIPLKIKGFFVNQKLLSLHANCAHSIRQRVLIIHKSDFYLIQIGLKRLPEMNMFNMQDPCRPAALCNFMPFLIKYLYLADIFFRRTVSTPRLNLIMDIRTPSVYLRRECNILDIRFRRRINSNRTRNSTIVKEIKIGMVLGF